MGRFCDQFLNALDGLYKGRIIAQTARESATGDTPLRIRDKLPTNAARSDAPSASEV